MFSQSIPAITKFGLSSTGFRVSYIDNKTVHVGPGVCRDSNNVMDIVIGGPTANGGETPVPVLLDATKNGVNGLDKGVLESGAVYSVFVIADSSGYNLPATLLVKENTEALMPTGYDSKRLQSYIAADGAANITLFSQLGLGVDKQVSYFGSMFVLQNGNSTSPALIDLSPFIPSFNSGITVCITTDINPASPGNILNINNIYSVTGQVIGIECENNISDVLVGYSGNTPVLQYYVSNSSDLANVTLTGFTFSI